jgi:hypothetical protein
MESKTSTLQMLNYFPHDRQMAACYHHTVIHGVSIAKPEMNRTIRHQSHEPGIPRVLFLRCRKRSAIFLHVFSWPHFTSPSLGRARLLLVVRPALKKTEIPENEGRHAYTTPEIEVKNMSDNNEHQRVLKQEAHKKRRINFHREHGRWPEDSEISDAAAPQTAATTPATVEQDHPFDYLSEPRG